MARADTDNRLLETQRESASRIEALPFEDERAKQCQQLAHAELTDSAADFEAAIKAEDAEEFEAVAAQTGLSEASARLDAGFGKMKQGMDITLKRLELTGGLPSRADEIRSYVDGHTASSFERANVKVVRSVVERGLEYANEIFPEDLRDQIAGEVEASLLDYAAKREQFGKEHAEHLAAFEKLEKARTQARNAHLNARDLMATALRREGIEDRLNSLIPTLRQAMYGADAPTPAPEPVEA